MRNEEVELNFINLSNMANYVTKFPSKVAYAIVRNRRILEPIYQDIILCKRNILEKYGRLDETKGAGYYDLGSEENVNKAKRELEEVDKIDTEVTINKISFSDIENLSLSLQEMDALYFMLDEF